MQQWSGPDAATQHSAVDDAARARTIRAAMAQASALRRTDAIERRRSSRRRRGAHGTVTRNVP